MARDFSLMFDIGKLAEGGSRQSSGGYTSREKRYFEDVYGQSANEVMAQAEQWGALSPEERQAQYGPRDAGKFKSCRKTNSR